MRRNKTIYVNAGKMVRINLSNKSISSEPVIKYAKEWLGSTLEARKAELENLRIRAQ